MEHPYCNLWEKLIILPIKKKQQTVEQTVKQTVEQHGSASSLIKHPTVEQHGSASSTLKQSFRRTAVRRTAVRRTAVRRTAVRRTAVLFYGFFISHFIHNHLETCKLSAQINHYPSSGF
jgi:hypothetical protein